MWDSFSYEFAFESADSLVNELKTECERIQIVGSLRRQKQSVNDVDILAIPKFLPTIDDTLFSNPIDENLLDKRLSDLCLSGQLGLEANGPKIKRFLKRVGDYTVPIDIYIATEQTWWTLLLIRTGSRSHNIKLARRAMDLRMHLKANGSGLLPHNGRPVQMNSEEEIFRHLRMDYRPPEERD